MTARSDRTSWANNLLGQFCDCLIPAHSGRWYAARVGGDIHNVQHAKSNDQYATSLYLVSLHWQRYGSRSGCVSIHDGVDQVIQVERFGDVPLHTQGFGARRVL